MAPVVQATAKKSGLTPANRATRDGIEEAGAEIQFTDLWRGAGTIAKAGDVRIDVQGVWSEGGWNIQAQVGNKSFAAILLSDTLEGATLMQQQGVINAVQQALNQSAAGQVWCTVTGSP